MPVHDCVIALGSNLGDRAGNLKKSLERINAYPGIHVVQCSTWHETTSIGGPGEQPEFLNGAARLETELEPLELFATLQKIECDLGRQRDVRWGARTIDLDLLVFDQLILDDPPVLIPHPRMVFRRFVLAPAVEVAAEVIHPTTGWTIEDLHKNLLRRPTYIALAGPPGVGKTSLAQQLKQRLKVELTIELPHENLLRNYFRDPIRYGWETEIKLLRQRSLDLEARQFENMDAVIVSDFWFNQSCAFAQFGLNRQHERTFQQQWEAARKKVLSPSLVVLLDAPTKVLLTQIRQKHPVYEHDITSDWLNQLRQTFDQLVRTPHVGPFLRIDTTRLDPLEEIEAAILAIRN